VGSNPTPTSCSSNSTKGATVKFRKKDARYGDSATPSENVDSLAMSGRCDHSGAREVSRTTSHGSELINYFCSDCNSSYTTYA
jgi:hypothetical protein